jgi:alpha-methylacyl-CoA racemase
MGPLHGTRVLEMAGLAPVPFAGMMLADVGADVLRIDSSTRYAPHAGPLDRGKSRVEVNLNEPAGRELARELAAKADVLLEGFRPGVTERLGVGPDDLRELNPRLIYGRLTGWGQDGPLAPRVGHDINYIGLTGVLDIIGRKGVRFPRQTLSTISPVAECFWPRVSWRRCSNESVRGAVRSSMRRWSTAPVC